MTQEGGASEGGQTPGVSGDTTTMSRSNDTGKSSSSNYKSKSSGKNNTLGYFDVSNKDFEGDTPEIGCVLGLRSEKITKKVQFDTF